MRRNIVNIGVVVHIIVDNASIMKYASEFNGIDRKDENRIATAHKKGGMACLD